METSIILFVEFCLTEFIVWPVVKVITKWKYILYKFSLVANLGIGNSIMHVTDLQVAISTAHQVLLPTRGDYCVGCNLILNHSLSACANNVGLLSFCVLLRHTAYTSNLSEIDHSQNTGGVYFSLFSSITYQKPSSSQGKLGLLNVLSSTRGTVVKVYFAFFAKWLLSNFISSSVLLSITIS